MKKKLSILKKILITACLSGVIFLIVNGVVENVQIDKILNDFMSRGECGSVEQIGDKKVILCHVSRETTEEAPAFHIEGDTVYVGSAGDILLRRTASVKVPLIYEFITFFIGGHASLVAEDYTLKYETAGNYSDGKNCVKIEDNLWFYSPSPIFAVRVKDASEEDINNAIENIRRRFGEPYNYSFLFNTEKSHYCTDLLAKAWAEVDPKYSINDGFVTTVNDILVSSNVYLTFYRYIDGEGINHVYYLV